VPGGETRLCRFGGGGVDGRPLRRLDGRDRPGRRAGRARRGGRDGRGCAGALARADQDSSRGECDGEDHAGEAREEPRTSASGTGGRLLGGRPVGPVGRRAGPGWRAQDQGRDRGPFPCRDARRRWVRLRLPPWTQRSWRAPGRTGQINLGAPPRRTRFRRGRGVVLDLPRPILTPRSRPSPSPTCEPPPSTTNWCGLPPCGPVHTASVHVVEVRDRRPHPGFTTARVGGRGASDGCALHETLRARACGERPRKRRAPTRRRHTGSTGRAHPLCFGSRCRCVH
jgi:hypothetical protein